MENLLPQSLSQDTERVDHDWQPDLFTDIRVFTLRDAYHLIFEFREIPDLSWWSCICLAWATWRYDDGAPIKSVWW